jgi:hypothetical protein
MSREIDNALLTHGGTEDIDIPAPAVRAILTDAVCTGELVREVDALKKQNAALEEANKRVCDERDLYKSLCHQLEARLAGREFE